MKIEKLEINDFRNINYALISPHENVNIIYGQNAQGKTNLLESIYILSGNKSFKGAKEVQMINFDKDFFKIDMDFSDKERIQNIKYVSEDIGYSRASIYQWRKRYGCGRMLSRSRKSRKQGGRYRRRPFRFRTGDLSE